MALLISLRKGHSRSEKQIPHPAKTAGIRDDICAGTDPQSRMSTEPFEAWISRNVQGLAVAMEANSRSPKRERRLVTANQFFRYTVLPSTTVSNTSVFRISFAEIFVKS
jgi:hypothetical protein